MSTSIPRRKGKFCWRQFAIFRELGVRTGTRRDVRRGNEIGLVPEADRRGNADDPQ